MSSVDIIINGGGMVGLALAAALSNALKIVIIDPQLPVNVSEYEAKQNDNFQSRVSAISKRSENFLTSIQAWKLLPVSRLSAYSNMKIWEQNGSEQLEFSAKQACTSHLGFIIENELLRSALYQLLHSKSNITFIATTIDAIDRSEEQIKCTLADQSNINARLLIAADGAQSFVRKSCGFHWSEKPYQQKALVANIKTEKPHQFCAYQRFLTTGPIAYLPLPNQHHCSIVWSATEPFAEEVLNLNNAEQQQRIAQALDSKLGAVSLLDPLRAFPLIARHADDYVQEKIALIGDAAHTIHPLAGQGVNLGFADAEVLAEVINHAHAKKQPIGSLANLRKYQRQRKGDNWITQQAMTLLNDGYMQQDIGWVIARNIGVKMINASGLVKSELIKKAMGI